jgi:hypothetical protein
MGIMTIGSGDFLLLFVSPVAILNSASILSIEMNSMASKTSSEAGSINLSLRRSSGSWR